MTAKELTTPPNNVKTSAPQPIRAQPFLKPGFGLIYPPPHSSLFYKTTFGSRIHTFRLDLSVYESPPRQTKATLLFFLLPTMPCFAL